MTLCIEDIVLKYDRRGIGRLRGEIGECFCATAAEHLLDTQGPILIGTGFYISHAAKPETDGPPGTIALARALMRIGRSVALVTDEICAPMLEKAADGLPLHVLPMDAGQIGRAAARALLDRVRPGLLVAIERCGPDVNDRFLQFNGTDISRFTGRMDYLFDGTIPSIGIVDGGNEVGIGSVAASVAKLPGLPNSPCVTPTDRIVLGSIANWGSYGLLAALSQTLGSMLVPTVEEEAEIRSAVVAAGAIDGDSGEAIEAVDGYPSELNGLVVERLRRFVSQG